MSHQMKKTTKISKMINCTEIIRYSSQVSVIIKASWTTNFVIGVIEMGETGKKDKGKKEPKKKPKLTIKEKRKIKHEKQSGTGGISG